MRTRPTLFLIPLFTFLGFLKLYSQDYTDYIVTLKNDTIKNIKVVAYPKEPTVKGWPYRKKLSTKYEDMRISYVTPNLDTKKGPLVAFYSEVKVFSVDGTVYQTWHSRDFNYKDGKITFDEIIEIPGQNAKQLLALSKSFLLNYFKFTNDNFNKFVVQDTLVKSLTVRNITITTFTYSDASSPTFTDFVQYDLLIRTKDDKCRITVDNMRIHYEKGFALNDKYKEENDETMEQVAKNWIDEDGDVGLQQYEGLLYLVYNVQDKLFPAYKDYILKNGSQTEDDW